jgi:ubiquinone biosynthesis protein Coq4
LSVLVLVVFVVILFWQLVKNPGRTELIFKGVEIVSNDPDQKPVKVVEDAVMSIPSFKAMYEEEYAPLPPAMEMLQKCPEGSFGQAVYQHMKSNCLSFDLFPRYDSKRPIKYLSSRIYQDHDLWHALFGYGISVEDELAVQAFGLAQFQSPVALTLIAGGLIHLLVKSPQRALDAFKRINEMYDLGKRAPFLLGVRLHDLFSRPLAEVRQLCGMMG